MIWKELINSTNRINFKIYKILNFGLVILLAKKCRWKMSNIVLTNLLFLGTCDQNTFVCWYNIWLSCRIPCLPPHKEKQDCMKPASVLFFSSHWWHWTLEHQNIGSEEVPGLCETSWCITISNKDDFKQNVWHRWERNLTHIIFMKDGWPHIKQSHQSTAISADRRELGT